MITIYSSYKPPRFVAVSGVGESITVQGLVTSLSVILNGGDDNNMKTLDLGYSEQVRDLYPEMFGRPTKYEMDYINQHRTEFEPGVSSDIPPVEPSPAPGTSDASVSTPNAEE